MALIFNMFDVIHAFEFVVNFKRSALMFLKHCAFWNFPVTNGCSFSVPSELINSKTVHLNLLFSHDNFSLRSTEFCQEVCYKIRLSRPHYIEFPDQSTTALRIRSNTQIHREYLAATLGHSLSAMCDRCKSL
jgi:hypothetical protein